MGRRRMLRLVAAFLLVAGSALVAFGAPAGAGDLADSGWWYVRPGATGQPPTVPAGGLYVAGAPDGAIAIAAVRYTLSEDETEPKLTLQVAAPGASDEGEGGEEPAPGGAPVPVPGGAPVPAPGGAPAPPAEAAPVILACQAGAGWSGVEAGSADAAPPPACGVGSVAGVPSADGLSWEWDLAKLQIKTTVDVILVAGKVKDLPDGANGSTFQLAFAKPTAESLETIEGSAPEPFTPPGGGAGDFGGAPDLAEGGAADGFSAGSGSVDGGGEVSFDAGDDTTSEGPALPEEQQGLTPTAPLVQAQQPAPEVAAAEPVGSTRDTRWLGIVVVLLAGVVAVMANQQPVPPLRGLGPFRREVPAEAVVGPSDTGTGGGLGRFAKSRSGAAPRL